MTDKLDLEAYFRRIGFEGTAGPSLETLRALHVLHPHAISFENLDPFLGRAVQLEPLTLQQKLVGSRRGGYCFEHNLLFKQVLEQMGFQVTGLAARVLMNRPEGAITPRGHMLSRVTLGGEDWLVDVGFGGLTQTAPLRLQPGIEQETPHGPFRVTTKDDDFMVEAFAGGAWRALYRFDLQHQHDVDYIASNYFLSASPDSHFRTTLILARALPDRRYALRNNQLSIHHLGRASEHRRFVSANELADAVDELFDLELPDRTAFLGRVGELRICNA